MIRRAVLLGILMPVALAGCTSRSGPYGDLPSPRHEVAGLLGRQCAYIAEPLAPASLDALARPGTRGAVLLWARDTAPSDSVDLSVRYDAEGQLSWVRVLRTTMAADRVVELERILTGGLVARGARDWGVRLRVVGGEVSVLPSVTCRPEQGSLTGRVMAPMGSAQDIREWYAAGRHLAVEVALDELGRVVNVRLAQGSGSRLLDQFAVDLARAYSYAPKLHDGLGVPSTLSLRLRMPRRF